MKSKGVALRYPSILFQILNDAGLLNNYIYLLILSDNLERAESELARVDKLSPQSDDIALTATKGLWYYRTGTPEWGKLFYQKAIETARREKNTDSWYRATLCLAREEKRCGNPISELIKQLEDPKYAPLRKFYDTLIKNFGILYLFTYDLSHHRDSLY